MRILLDEDLDVRLRRHFRGDHQVETVQFRGWKGMKNGELLEVASACIGSAETGLSRGGGVRDFDLIGTHPQGAAPSSKREASGSARG